MNANAIFASEQPFNQSTVVQPSFQKKKPQIIFHRRTDFHLPCENLPEGVLGHKRKENGGSIVLSVVYERETGWGGGLGAGGKKKVLVRCTWVNHFFVLSFFG